MWVDDDLGHCRVTKRVEMASENENKPGSIQVEEEVRNDFRNKAGAARYSVG